MKLLYRLEKLSCSYSKDNGSKVLYVENLIIPKGKLIFLLGASGAGKSTLLETLGLMNDTISGGDVQFVPKDSVEISYNELWNSKSENTISEIRKKHFGFIFQNTNLMENFTAYENVSLSKMVKENPDLKDAIENSKQLMIEVGLPLDEVGLEKLAVNLSGGQRQRLSFVRALGGGFTVLFGDEPTGNLDDENSNELLNILKSHLDPNTSAIIVSHDIELAVEHADQIIVITKDPAIGFGEILPENIYDRAHWQKFTGEERIKFREKLLRLYGSHKEVISAAENEIIQPVPESALLNPNENYRELFLRQEGKELAGKLYINFLKLLTILFFTFFVIGFANGGLVYLTKKMDNAFVKWLDISIPIARHNEVPDIQDRLSQLKLMDQFDYKSVAGYIEHPLWFFNADLSDYKKVKGRSIYPDNGKNPLLSEIQNASITPFKNATLSNKDMAIVVKKAFLDSLGYDLNSPVIYMAYQTQDSFGNVDYAPVPIQIRSVVNEIPGRNSVVFTPSFFNAETGTMAEDVFNLNLKKNLRLFIRTDKEDDANNLRSTLEEILENNTSFTFSSIHPPKKAAYSYMQGYQLNLFFRPPLTKSDADVLWTEILKTGKLDSFDDRIYRNYQYPPGDTLLEGNFSKLSVHFNSLDRVRDFTTYFETEFNPENENRLIEIDVAKIKEKENFNFLSKVTKIVAWLLVFFGAISLSLFIFNMLKMHLSKVEKNIGTLKAFGMNNKEAQNIYFKIILKFVGLGALIAFTLALVIGWTVNIVITGGFTVEQGVSYFHLFHPNTLWTLLILTISTIWISWSTIRAILSKTPGDLIYGR